MPIYEYVCEACGRLTEVMQRLNDPPPAACPECGETRLARLVSRTSFQLKGGGWYSDLYGSRKKPEPAADGGKPGATGAPAPAAGAPSPGAAAAGAEKAPVGGTAASSAPGSGAAGPKDGAAR